MIQLQNSHFTRPSTWISVMFERPQFRQCQFRTDSFMKCPLSRRSPATDASRKGGAEPSEGSEASRVSPLGAFCRLPGRVRLPASQSCARSRGPSGGRRRGCLRCRRRRSGRCRGDWGRRSLDPQSESRGCAERRDRRGVRRRRSGLGDRALGPVLAGPAPRAARAQEAEGGDHRQDSTRRSHRPSAPTTFVASCFRALTHFDAATPAARCK
jgi:hypothetical protein